MASGYCYDKNGDAYTNENAAWPLQKTVIIPLDEYDEILCYGIAFFKKRCVVKKK